MNDKDKNIVPLGFSLSGIRFKEVSTISDAVRKFDRQRLFSWLDPSDPDHGLTELLDSYARHIMAGKHTCLYPELKDEIKADDVKIILEKEPYFITIIFMVRRTDGKVYSSGFRTDLVEIGASETFRDGIRMVSLAIHNFILLRLKDTLREVQTSGYLDGSPVLPETDTALQDAFRQEGKDDKELKRSQNPKRSKRHKLVSLTEAVGIAAARAEKAEKAKKSKKSKQ